jgi:hypothetical protein
VHELVEVEIVVVGQAAEPVVEVHPFLLQFYVDLFEDAIDIQFWMGGGVPYFCRSFSLWTLVLSSRLSTSSFYILYLSCLIFLRSSSFSIMRDRIKYISTPSLLVLASRLLLAFDDVLQAVGLQDGAEVAFLPAAEDERELVGFEELVGESLVFGVVPGRGEERVDGDSECVFEHGGDDACEEGAGEFEAGVGVDLDEPGVEVFVDHEVQSEYLEGELPVFGVDDQVGGADGVGGELLDRGWGTTMRG